MTQNPESKIKYLMLYGLIKSDSTFFDDIENVDEKIALRKKIIKIEIYTGKKKIEQNEKDAFSFFMTWRSLSSTTSQRLCTSSEMPKKFGNVFTLYYLCGIINQILSI